MSADALRFVALAAAAVIVVASGIRLTRSGRPYSGVLLNVHKLVDLAAMVIVAIAAYQRIRSADLAAAGWIVAMLAAVLFIAVLVTGGVQSALEDPPTFVSRFHRLGSWVAIVLTAATVYFTTA